MPRSRRMLAVLAFCVLALAGGIVAVVIVGLDTNSKGGGSTPTTGAYAPLTVPKPPLIMSGGVILDEPDAENQDWLSAALTPLPGTHRYEITVTNASNVGYINSFEWYPPSNARIVAVTGSSSGHCTLTGIPGFGGSQFKTVLLYPNIFCSKIDLKPPSCTCRGDGGSMTVSFTLNSEAFFAGAARVVSATPVLRIIPSYVNP
jgi:hypothetical protein